MTCLIDVIETAHLDPVVDTITLCAPAPLVRCRQTVQPRRSRLTFRDVTVDGADVLRWSWTHGAATGQSDFGDPVTTTSYAVCLYDAPSSLFLGLRVPAGGDVQGRPMLEAARTLSARRPGRPRSFDVTEPMGGGRTWQTNTSDQWAPRCGSRPRWPPCAS